MTVADDSTFAGSIVRLYDEVLGPFMFEPFAREVAARLSGASGEVLEVAAGTGILTQALDDALAPDALIIATDLNRPMLQLASERRPSTRVTWRQADALQLPFPDKAFDVVVCQFGIMFYPDPLRGHGEAFRVLKPGGRYILSVWDDLPSNPIADTVHGAVAACFPGDPPDFLARIPHGHHDIAALSGSLAAAGFAAPASDKVALAAGRLTADELAEGFCQGTPLRHQIERRGGVGLAGVTRAVAIALQEVFGQGAIESRIQAQVLVAVRPRTDGANHQARA